ncbi:MAG: twin-arginine translocase subunit TatC [Anaerolineales bacterium]|nr:twin-arginine translocase subunit TatC [Anaerolineales bacterium]
MRKFFLGVGKALTFPSRAIRSIIAFFRAEPTEQPLGEMLASIATSREFRDAILEQIEAFRKHLLRALLALILATIAGWFLTEPVIALLAGPVGGPERLQIIDLTESIGVFMKIAVLLGLAISIPYIAFEFWLFAALKAQTPRAVDQPRRHSHHGLVVLSRHPLYLSLHAAPSH